MIVLLNDHIYEMSRKQFRSVLSVAKKAVKHGIYAVQKGDVCELRKDEFENSEELEKAVGAYKENGFKVHYNV